MTIRNRSLLTAIFTLSLGSNSYAQPKEGQIEFDPDLKPKAEQVFSVTEMELIPVPTSAQLDAIEKAEKQDVDKLAPDAVSPGELGKLYTENLLASLKSQPTNKSFMLQNLEQASDLLKVHSLNIGAGSCHVIQCPAAMGRKMIIDCGKVGEAGKNDMTPDDVKAYFASISSTGDPAPIVVSTHPDSDHYIYLEAMLDGRKPHAVWLGGIKENPTAFDAKKKYGTENFYSLVRGWAAAGVPVKENFPPRFHNGAKAVAELQCGAMKTYILTVNTNQDLEEDNDQSLMVLIEYGNFRGLFGGDAYEASQLAAAKNLKEKIYRVNLLTASHHGSDRHKSNNAAWAEATRPGIVIYSSGKHYGHPHCAAVSNFIGTGSLYRAKEHNVSCGYDERVTATKRAEYVTDDNGFVIVAADGQGRIGVSCKRGGNCGLDQNQVRPPLDLEFEALVKD